MKGGGLFWVISREEEAATASAPRVCVCAVRATLAWTMPAPLPGFTWLVSSTLKMREDGWPRALPSKKVPFFRSVAANFSDRQLQLSTQRDAGARTRNIQQLRREFYSGRYTLTFDFTVSPLLLDQHGLRS